MEETVARFTLLQGAFAEVLRWLPALKGEQREDIETYVDFLEFRPAFEELLFAIREQNLSLSRKQYEAILSLQEELGWNGIAEGLGDLLHQA